MIGICGCSGESWNNPYGVQRGPENVLYSSFTERPKHLDPAVAYSANEYVFIGQIYEPPLQYHYLIRPYTLVPLTAEVLPGVTYFDRDGAILPDDASVESIAYSDYTIRIRPRVRYQPHPAFAKDAQGQFLYHRLDATELQSINGISDFELTGSRELDADDYVYQIKRLVDPRIHSPIAELMKHYIVGLGQLGDELAKIHKSDANNNIDLKDFAIEGVKSLDRYSYRVRIRGKYPQFRYWLAMPFFSPMPWEAVEFYAQPGLREKNISLDWYPVGTGPYMLVENNPNRQMVLEKNPNYHMDKYPTRGEPGDRAAGLLDDAGHKLPFIDRVIYTLEKENIPYWNKFLQGYYDGSGIASDSFDQAIQFSGQGEAELTQAMHDKGIQLKTAVTTSIFYMGFNMLDPVVGGYSNRARELRQALSIAIDYEEYISIFTNGRGVAAQGLLPPGIFGSQSGEKGINPYVYDWVDGAPQRKSIDEAKRLLAEAGYPGGHNPKDGKPLVLYLDTVATGPDDKARLNWYRKQFTKLGIQLVIRTTDYNRFQQKMRNGDAQIFMWGWNADYPDPENFFFLLHGANAKVKGGGENAVNYQNPEFDKLFEMMRNMDDGEERFALIQQLQDIVRRDSPWIFGFHPKSFSLHHDWYKNLKPNLMANNRLKYTKIDSSLRQDQRRQWNKPVVWPFAVFAVLILVMLAPAWLQYRRKQQAKAK